MKECGCSVDDLLDDGPTVFSEHIRTARTIHVCCECKELIQSGQKYEDARGCWDGKFRHFATCDPCRRIRNNYCDSFWYGGLQTILEDCLGMDYLKADGERE